MSMHGDPSREPSPNVPCLSSADSRARRVSGVLLAIAVAVSLPLTVGCEESRAPAKTAAPSGAKTPGATETGSESASASSESKAPADSTTDKPEVATITANAKSEQPVAAPAEAPAAEDTATRNITFDRIKFDLKANADYKPEMLTPEIKALDGKNVRIRGFMFPSFKPTGLTEWVLVRDNMQCCFGGNAILYDCIIVNMKPGKSTDYTTRPVAVEGTFTIQDWFDLDGVRRAIYHLDGESVRF